MKKVILIGGSPMVGKSTVAALVASNLMFPCVSTDDIGEALQTVSDINPMGSRDYLDYYAQSDTQRLIDDMIEYHQKLEPAIARLIDIHSDWGNPLIMEGWALYPEPVGRINNEHVFSVWLIAEDGLLRKRMAMKKSFWQDAREPEKVIENYLYRSEWHNRKLLEQCKTEKQRYIVIGEDSTAEGIVKVILEMIKPD